MTAGKSSKQILRIPVTSSPSLASDTGFERNRRGILTHRNVLETAPRFDGAVVSVASARCEFAFDFGAVSDVGNERANNEDAHGHLVESQVSLVFAVADGVGGGKGAR
jgi:hypothetical protein